MQAEEIAAFGALYDVLSGGARSVRGSSVGSHDLAGRLAVWGLLVEDGVVDAVICDACDTPHRARTAREGDDWGWACPDEGFVPCPLDDLRRWQVTRQAFARKIAASLTLPRSFDAVDEASGLLRLGRMAVADLRAELFLTFAPMNANLLAAITTAIAKLHAPDHVIVLQALSEPEGGVALLPSCSALPFVEVLTIAPDGGIAIDWALLERCIADLLASRKVAAPGRPSGIEATRAVLSYLIARGLLPSGRNATARAVLAHWTDVFPGAPKPAESTIKEHLSTLRSS